MLSTLKRIRDERADAVLTETYFNYAVKTGEALTLLEGGPLCDDGADPAIEDPAIADIIDKIPEDDTDAEVISRILGAEGDIDVEDLLTPAIDL